MGPTEEVVSAMKKSGFYQVVEVAKKYKIPYSTITGWIDKNKVTCVKNGRFQFVPEKEVTSMWTDFQNMLKEKEKKVEKKIEKKA